MESFLSRKNLFYIMYKPLLMLLLFSLLVLSFGCTGVSTNYRVFDVNDANIALFYVPYVGASGDVTLGLHDLNAYNVYASEFITTAYFCDRFGVGCWDMTGDPHYFSGMDIRFSQDAYIDWNLFIGTPSGHDPTITFMSDGGDGVMWWEDVGDRFNFDHGITVDGTVLTDELVTESIRWAVGDYLVFNPTDNNWQFLINNIPVFEIESDGNVLMTGDLNVLSKIEHEGIYAQMGVINDSDNIADVVVVTNGTITSGDVNATRFIDQNYLVVNETGKFDINYVFEDTVGNPTRVHFKGRYVGNPSHVVWIYAWNFVSDTWVRLTAASNDFPSSSTDYSLSFEFPADNNNYAENGVVMIRIYHDSNPVGSHDFYTDYISITTETLSLPLAGTEYMISGLTPGLSSNVTVDSNSFTIQVPGVYDFDGAICFSGTDNMTVTGRPYVNGNPSPIIAFKRKLGSNGDTGCAAGNGIVRLAAGNIMTFYMQSDTPNSFVSYDTLSVKLRYLGR